AFRNQLREEYLTYNVGLIVGGTTAQTNPQDTGGQATGSQTSWRQRRLRSGVSALSRMSRCNACRERCVTSLRNNWGKQTRRLSSTKPIHRKRQRQGTGRC